MKEKNELKLKSNNPEQTRKLAFFLGNFFLPGEIILLIGEMGGGKTVFTKGIAESLEIRETITSPTFMLVREYQGKIKLHHFDLYRIEDWDELLAIGIYDYFREDTLNFIEWGNRIQENLEEENFPFYKIDFSWIEEQEREITINYYHPDIDQQNNKKQALQAYLKQWENK